MELILAGSLLVNIALAAYLLWLERTLAHATFACDSMSMSLAGIAAGELTIELRDDEVHINRVEKSNG
tara:strand:- start:3895 stop:4098 length:204 start_codon:yes stop_codon:yes gene_type:complete